MSHVSVVPRGFSRFYVLWLLKEKEKPMTGKGIMEETQRKTNGTWKPSPGLVYPLLGKLLAEGLIVEAAGGGYVITSAGERVLEQYEQTRGGLDELFNSFMRVGLFGKLVAQDFSDRVISFLTSVRDDLSKLTAEQRTKYREFLRQELLRMEGEDRDAESTKTTTPGASQ